MSFFVAGSEKEPSFIESLVLGFLREPQNGKSAKIVLCVIRQILLNLIF